MCLRKSLVPAFGLPQVVPGSIYLVRRKIYPPVAAAVADVKLTSDGFVLASYYGGISCWPMDVGIPGFELPHQVGHFCHHLYTTLLNAALMTQRHQVIECGGNTL